MTGVADGRLLTVNPVTAAVATVANTGGRPLGVECFPDGRLLVCDAERGLLRVTPGRAGDPGLAVVEPLAPQVPLRLCDNAAISPDGTIWFTDSSCRHDLARYQADLVEGIGTGRLLRRDSNGQVEVVLRGLQFANGVALAADSSFVAVAETGAQRILRLWLTGSRAGTHDVLAELPGFPDNLSTGTDGTIWVALPRPYSRAMALARRCPFSIRRLLGGIGARLDPGPRPKIRVLGLDTAGRIARDINEHLGGYRMVTGVREQHDTLYLGSLLGDAIALLPLSIPPRRSTPVCD
jgi:sugar lactone lactonase YvrE